jgi:hypothetical protein
MKNASIQVNAEKRIVNVGLRLFYTLHDVGKTKKSDFGIMSTCSTWSVTLLTIFSGTKLTNPILVEKEKKLKPENPGS